MQWISNAKFGVPEEQGTIFKLKALKATSNVIIHKLHGCGDGWYFLCHPLGFEHENLNTEDFDVAVKQMKKLIAERMAYLQALYLPMAYDISEIRL